MLNATQKNPKKFKKFKNIKKSLKKSQKNTKNIFKNSEKIQTYPKNHKKPNQNDKCQKFEKI